MLASLLRIIFIAAFCAGTPWVSAKVSSSSLSLEEQEQLKKDASKSSLVVQVGMQNQASETLNEKVNLFGIKGRLFGKQRMTDWVRMRAAAEVVLQTGDVQYTYFEQSEPKNEFSLLYGHLTLSKDPESYFLTAGALDPNDTLSWPRFRNISFPGFQAGFAGHTQTFELKMQGAQTFASQSLTSRQAERDRSTPTFNTQGVEAKWQPGRHWSGQLAASRWSFSDLTNETAHQSRFFGNEVEGEGRDLARFAYGFEGFSFGAKTELNNVLGMERLTLRGQWLENTKAPQGTRAGYEVGLGAALRASASHRLSFEAGPYAMGMNAFPAYYLNEARGMANSQGIFARFNYDYLPEKVMAQVYFASGEAITDNPYQDTSYYFLINLVQQYDFL